MKGLLEVLDGSRSSIEDHLVLCRVFVAITHSPSRYTQSEAVDENDVLPAFRPFTQSSTSYRQVLTEDAFVIIVGQTCKTPRLFAARMLR